MTRFKLLDENNNDKEYVLHLDFSSDEAFVDWSDNPSFITFMDSMECGNNPWNGVHDGTGGIDDDGIEWSGYHSYEIQDFTTAIKMWETFFKEENKLIP